MSNKTTGDRSNASQTLGSSGGTLSRRGAWLALTAALLGWMFDGLEMGLFPLVGRTALADLLGSSPKELVQWWFGVMMAVFLVGAATGGVLFGWLGDRIGRVRAMALSVLTYSLFMGLCGISRNVHEFFGYRFVSALGMGGEWSLGVALVMEIWPNRTRAFMAGLIGAASNVGFFLIAVMGLWLANMINPASTADGSPGAASLQNWLLYVGLPKSWVDYLVLDSNKAPTIWRLLMVLAATPALLTFFIRLMVPESQRWQQAKQRGDTSNWALGDMLGVLGGAAGALAIIFFWLPDRPGIAHAGNGAAGALDNVYRWASSFSLPTRIIGSIIALGIAAAGYMYPVIRFLQRSGNVEGDPANNTGATLRRMGLGACLSGVALIGTWASIQFAPAWAGKLVEVSMPDASREAQAAAKSAASSYTQIASALGAIIGTIVAALMGNFISRRLTYSLLCVGSLASALVFFQLNTHYGNMFLIGVFVAGGITASFYGWLPLYLPELFRTTVRATGQGFSFNFGRILAAIGALQAGYLMKVKFDEDFATACSIMSSVYLVGLVLIWFAPETRGKPLPE